MPELDGKIFLVTGGGSGIGAAGARLAAAAGARVVVADLDLAAAREVAGPLDAEARAVDVRDTHAVAALVEGSIRISGVSIGRAALRRGFCRTGRA